MKRVAALVLVASLVGAREAHAYRPFVGTDADVAELNTVELELGALQAERVDGATIYEPGFVFNYGFSAGLELVVDMDGMLPLGAMHGDRLLASDVLVKDILHRGSLQGRHGPSLALETGVLLPTVPARGVDEAGWSVALITSQQWAAVTVHVTLEAAVERDRDLSGLASVIAEGPDRLRVRPVVELLVGKDEGRDKTTSVLAGAIWQATRRLALDAAARIQRDDGTTAFEGRLGLTWVIAR